MTDFTQNPENQKRPSWALTWLTISDEIAKRSLCSRDQVGAVIVDVHNRVVATSYNGPPHGFNHNNLPCVYWCPRAQSNGQDLPRDYVNCPANHAEANAIANADRSRMIGATIYVSSDICMGCAKLIANSGISFYCLNPVNKPQEHRQSSESYDFLKKCGIGQLLPNPGDYEDK